MDRGCGGRAAQRMVRGAVGAGAAARKSGDERASHHPPPVCRSTPDGACGRRIRRGEPVALLCGVALRRSGVASLEEPGREAQEGGCVSGEQ